MVPAVISKLMATAVNQSRVGIRRDIVRLPEVILR